MKLFHVLARAFMLTFLVSLACAAAPAEKVILSDAQLRLADQALVSSYSRFPVDRRYNDTLNRVTFRLLRSSQEPRMGEVRLAVHYSNLGFNGLALYRLVVLDSLLLDGLKRYAQGAVLYGTVANEYTEKLAMYIGGLHRQGRLGEVGKEFDAMNPYRIPPPPDFKPEMEPQAEAVFEEMLAAWLCHEVSHIFLGHVEERYLSGQDMQHRLAMESIPPEVLQEMVRGYLDYSLGPLKEFEADTLSLRLLTGSGYSREGIRRVLFLCKRIEEASGYATRPLRTHPRPVLRWRHLVEP